MASPDEVDAQQHDKQPDRRCDTKRPHPL
jgi:hypothetical protein